MNIIRVLLLFICLLEICTTLARLTLSIAVQTQLSYSPRGQKCRHLQPFSTDSVRYTGSLSLQDLQRDAIHRWQYFTSAANVCCVAVSEEDDDVTSHKQHPNLCNQFNPRDQFTLIVSIQGHELYGYSTLVYVRCRLSRQMRRPRQASAAWTRVIATTKRLRQLGD